MTYNKEELLKMLSVTPLQSGIEFHDGKHEEFFNSLKNDFFDYYDYAHGASKLALIPISEENDYVIKIPYTGSYNYRSGYFSGSVYHFHEEDYWPFEQTGGEREWDYCANEARRYLIAEKNGFAKCFAKTEFLGYVNNYPIYVQEKCVTLDNCCDKHYYSLEENHKTSKCCNGYRWIDTNWLTDFRLYYGEDTLFNFVNFIANNNWDDDLRTENIGYIDNRPVLIDYSGFLE